MMNLPIVFIHHPTNMETQHEPREVRGGESSVEPGQDERRLSVGPTTTTLQAIDRFFSAVRHAFPRGDVTIEIDCGTSFVVVLEPMLKYLRSGLFPPGVRVKFRPTRSAQSVTDRSVALRDPSFALLDRETRSLVRSFVRYPNHTLSTESDDVALRTADDYHLLIEVLGITVQMSPSLDV